MIAVFASLLLALAPPDERLDDPALEARAVEITNGLRCLVCEGQGVNDSNAGFAEDVRRFVRAEIANGASDAQVREALRIRFGDEIFQRPPFKASTLLLWLGPFIAAIAGAGVFLARTRETASVSEAPLSEEERARIDTVMRTPQS